MSHRQLTCYKSAKNRTCQIVVWAFPRLLSNTTVKTNTKKKINNDVNKSSGLEMGLCSVEWMGLATALCSDVFTGER